MSRALISSRALVVQRRPHARFCFFFFLHAQRSSSSSLRLSRFVIISPAFAYVSAAVHDTRAHTVQQARYARVHRAFNTDTSSRRPDAFHCDSFLVTVRWFPPSPPSSFFHRVFPSRNNPLRHRQPLDYPPFSRSPRPFSPRRASSAKGPQPSEPYRRLFRSSLRPPRAGRIMCAADAVRPSRRRRLLLQLLLVAHALVLPNAVVRSVESPTDQKRE